MKKDIEIVVQSDSKGVSIEIKSGNKSDTAPVLLKELTTSEFASIITNDICEMFNLSDDDNGIYNRLYQFGKGILTMPADDRSVVSIFLKIDVADFKEDFGYRLKNRRETLGMKREFVASKMDVSTSIVTKWETGERNVPINRLVELCSILKISPNELLGWEE